MYLSYHRTRSSNLRSYPRGTSLTTMPRCSCIQVVIEESGCYSSATAHTAVTDNTQLSRLKAVQGQKVKGQGHKVTYEKFTPSRALALETLESKRPLIVVVAPQKLYGQIGVGDFINVIVFDSMLTGHVIRRMRSGCIRIFNGNQWETL